MTHINLDQPIDPTYLERSKTRQGETEKLLNDNREQLDASAISDVEAAVKTARASLDTEEANTDELKQATEALQQASHQLAQTMYAQAEDADGGAAEEASPEVDGEIIEAEVVEDESS